VFKRARCAAISTSLSPGARAAYTGEEEASTDAAIGCGVAVERRERVVLASMTSVSGFRCPSVPEDMTVGEIGAPADREGSSLARCARSQDRAGVTVEGL